MPSYLQLKNATYLQLVNATYLQLDNATYLQLDNATYLQLNDTTYLQQNGVAVSKSCTANEWWNPEQQSKFKREKSIPSIGIILSW